MANGISRICQFLRRSPRAEFVAGGRREAKAKTTWEVVWFLGNLATRGRDLLVGGIEIRCSKEGGMIARVGSSALIQLTMPESLVSAQSSPYMA